MVASMSSVAVVKFFLMLYCRLFKNEIVRAYAQDHFFDVITNSIGLASALLAVRYKWWMDPVGAILVRTICKLVQLYNAVNSNILATNRAGKNLKR
jgi:divalent metal cation (Fe/Co/Zn/Cd) transporter